MLHTGDIYEVRARAARHHELRRLAQAVSGILFRRPTPGHRQPSQDLEPGCANDRSIETRRVA